MDLPCLQAGLPRTATHKENMQDGDHLGQSSQVWGHYNTEGSLSSVHVELLLLKKEIQKKRKSSREESFAY